MLSSAANSDVAGALAVAVAVFSARLAVLSPCGFLACKG